MFSRFIQKEIEVALTDTPVVLIVGPRQTGKSTLAEQVAHKIGLEYLSFDDDDLLSLARRDPAAFIGDLRSPTVLDEVQRAPELLRPIKLAVDRARKYQLDGGPSAAGMLLLTGSADIWGTLCVSESLAGRIQRVPLWPLAQRELTGKTGSIIDDLFSGQLPRKYGQRINRSDIADIVTKGGYPEVVTRAQTKRQQAWAKSYLDAVLQSDLRLLSNVQEQADIPRLLRLLATRVGNLVNHTDVAQSLSLSRQTVGRYTDLLEAVFLVQKLPAWRTNAGHRLIKSPKLWLTDTGLASALVGYNSERFIEDDLNLAGGLFENFVGIELLKQAAWAETAVNFLHYRTSGGIEADIVMEAMDGAVCAVEVKLAASIGKRDYRGLEHLRDTLGDKFKTGVLVYLGENRLPLGDRLWALPVTTLWQ